MPSSSPDMTLHLLKRADNPQAQQILASQNTTAAPAVVLLSDVTAAPSGKQLSYSQLVEMIFKADKVITW